MVVTEEVAWSIQGKENQHAYHHHIPCFRVYYEYFWTR